MLDPRNDTATETFTAADSTYGIASALNIPAKFPGHDPLVRDGGGAVIAKEGADEGEELFFFAGPLGDVPAAENAAPPTFTSGGDASHLGFDLTFAVINSPPTAVNDAYNVDEDTTLVVPAATGVLDNDTDADVGDVLTAVLDADVSSGTLTLIDDGSFTYDPDAHFNGDATFTYHANDGSLDSNIATVTITVNSINDDPTVAVPIPDVVANEDAPDVVLNLSATFADVDIVTDGDLLVLSVSLNDNPTLVAASFLGTTLTLDFLPDQNGAANITIRATDFLGPAFVEDTFLVTVNSVNDSPTVAVPIPDVIASEDAVNAVLDLSATFADVDIATDADVLTLSLTLNDNPTLIDASLLGTTLTIDFLPDQNGAANITIRATDLALAFVEDTFPVTVNPVNDAPTVAVPIPDVTVDEDAADEVLDLSATFADVDIVTNGDVLTLSVSANDNPTLVAASLLGTTLTLDFQPNQNGTANITIRATDFLGPAFVEDTFLVTVNAVNDAPVAVNDAFAIGGAPQVLVVAAPGVLANDTDPDVGDLLTAILDADVSNGTLVLSPNGGFSYAPDVGFGGFGVTDTFTYHARDDVFLFFLESNIVTVTITVNDPPVANDQTANVTQNTSAPRVITLTASDLNGDPLNAGTTGFTVVGPLPAFGTLSAITSLTETTASITYTPDTVYEFDDTFTFLVFDGADVGVGLASNIATVTINVVPPAGGGGGGGGPVNNPPEAVDDTYTVEEDTILIVAAPGLLDNDTDLDEDPLTALLDTVPSNGTLTLPLPFDGSFEYTPDPDFADVDSFTYRATDGDEVSNIATVTITVTPVNDPPVADDQSVVVDQATPTDIILTASDIDGDILTFSITNGPEDGLLGPVTPLTDTSASVTYTSDPDHVGPDSFMFVANDGLEDSNEATVSIEVIGNIPPIAVAAAVPALVDEGDPVLFDGSGSTDPDGSIVLFQWDFKDGSPIANGVAVLHTFVDNGTFLVELTVTDDDGATATDTVTVSVENEPPEVEVEPDEQDGDEGDPSISITFTDPSSVDTHNVSIVWGDGSSDRIDDATSLLSASHNYADDGTFVVNVSVTDDDGGVGGDTALMNIANVAPIVVAGPDQIIELGATTNVDSFFTDAGTADTHTATIAWGDGSPQSAGVVSEAGGSGTVDGSHVYADNGVFTVTFTVVDDDGGDGSDTLTAVVFSLILIPGIDISLALDRTEIGDGETALASVTVTNTVGEPVEDVEVVVLVDNDPAPGSPPGLRRRATRGVQHLASGHRTV